ncbi:hypothetical protein RZS08_07770, partial [Arthrospira platensis SPKY1]|nr:hypothetical protein [Arthrospira platensis SPKY1]
MAQQRVEFATVLREQGNAGAGGEPQTADADEQRLGDCGDEGAGHAPRLARQVNLGQQHEKAVAALARDQGAAAGGLLEALGEVLQGCVANLVPVATVDRLETVDVDAYHGHGAVAGEHARRTVVEAGLEQASIGQAGEQVVTGEVHGPQVGAAVDTVGLHCACAPRRSAPAGIHGSDRAGARRGGRGCAEDDGVDAGAQPWGSDEVEHALAARRQ